LGALAVFAFTQLWYANRQIALKDEAEQLANFNFNRYRYGEAVQGARDIYDSLARPLNVYFELSRDVDRVDSSLAKNATKSSQAGARGEFERAQKRVTLTQREQQGWLNQLNLYSEHLWEATNKSNRTKIVANVERVLASTADSQSKLRLAMYAVAAIPKVIHV